MPAPELFYNILQMDLENYRPLPAKGTGDDPVRRQRCGCLRTSEKLQQLLSSFPAPPPPSPAPDDDCPKCKEEKCKLYTPIPQYPSCNDYMPLNQHVDKFTESSFDSLKKPVSLGWSVAVELMKLVQLAVTATALALYYLVYCYMQLIYYTLRTALYFHEADGPMKITIGVVSVTTTIIAFNLLMRVERYVDIFNFF
ncbi:hypothetical protein MSG28_004718 [Choristoneura fumiferana]|uniref:Uncharacterized protein n=1 Tax=Choristoneura fumiferana TaxID=7141 RepID=A0ACC0K7A8_CHOFU|nr:hypothetical protein MSG28_004718 [Choristoneura fumiferana]